MTDCTTTPSTTPSPPTGAARLDHQGPCDHLAVQHQRGDTAAFPHETYSYGDGDQRLFADPASGYFYVYYGSRIVDKRGGWRGLLRARGPRPDRGEDGPRLLAQVVRRRLVPARHRRRESNIVPVDAGRPTGSTPRRRRGTTRPTPAPPPNRIAAGTMPPTLTAVRPEHHLRRPSRPAVHRHPAGRRPER
ncbi:hypothetical protein LT493_44660 [Streptomyces tricolor]|nr:hypothetical protein [Streptomyces tricolor]